MTHPKPNTSPLSAFTIGVVSAILFGNITDLQVVLGFKTEHEKTGGGLLLSSVFLALLVGYLLRSLYRADRTAGVQVISSILGVTVFLAARLGLGEIAGVLVGTKPIPFFSNLFLLILSLQMSLAATITFTGWMERKRA